MRRSATTNITTSTTPASARPQADGLSQARWALMSPAVSRPSPVVTSSPPRHGRPAADATGRLDRGITRRLHTVTARNATTSNAKIARHPANEVSPPPITGPSGAPRVPAMVHTVSARALSAMRGNRSAIRARLIGMNIPAPAPIRALAAMRHPTAGLAVPRTEPTSRPASPVSSTRRWPRRSPPKPASSRTTTKARL